MNENKLYYIRGVKDRGEEVINTLLEKYPNASNTCDYTGDCENSLYYVKNNNIDYTYASPTIGILLKEYGIELHLPELKPYERHIDEPLKFACKNLTCVWNNPVNPVFRDSQFIGVRFLAGKYNLIIAAKNFNNGNTMEWKDAMDALKNKGLRTFDKWESHAIFSHIDEINKCIEEYGGEILESWYWCSTKVNDYGAYSLLFSTGDCGVYGIKCNTFYVRAILN